MDNDSQREKDIQAVLRAVINTDAIYRYNPNGADTSTCPFCYQYVKYDEADMDKIDHLQNCAYLIAKDLLTNI